MIVVILGTLVEVIAIDRQHWIDEMRRVISKALQHCLSMNKFMATIRIPEITIAILNPALM